MNGLTCSVDIDPAEGEEAILMWFSVRLDKYADILLIWCGSDEKRSVESFGLDFLDQFLDLFVFGFHHFFQFPKL